MNLTDKTLQGQILDLVPFPPESLVHIGEVGSTTHGLGVSDQDDLDLTIIRLEGWGEFTYGDPALQSLMPRTQPDGHRSGPGDIDINLYTYRKFARLATKLNPSILNVFFLPESSVYHSEFPVSPLIDPVPFTYMLGQLHAHVVSKEAGRRYLGYMKAQMERWTGLRGQKNVNRPELVEKYGFDTKYAAHIIRLGYQGIEYLQTGQITIPMSTGRASLIKNLRTGAYEEEEALDWAQNVEAKLKEAMEASTLPERPNYDKIAEHVAAVYRLWFAH